MTADRISKAWMLRHALHAYLKTNSGATVVQLFASSPDVCTETIRKALRVLQADGDIGMAIGHGRVATYWTLTDEIKPEIQKRNKLGFAAIKSNKDKYVQAHALRVTVLAHIEAVGRVSGPDLASAIGITPDHANRTCNAMCKEGTLSRGGIGKSITYAATGSPLVSADVMRARVYKLRSENSRDVNKLAKQAVGGKGSKVHIGGQLKSTAQGGQGAVRQRVYVGATAGML